MTARQRQADAANAAANVQRWHSWAEAMDLPWHVVGMVTGAPFSEAAAAQVLEAWKQRQARQRTHTHTSTGSSGWTSDDELAQALRVLGLQRPFSHADVKRRKRELARQHHPDQGGSLQAMQRINQAADLALRWAAA